MVSGVAMWGHLGPPKNYAINYFNLLEFRDGDYSRRISPNYQHEYLVRPFWIEISALSRLTHL